MLMELDLHSQSQRILGLDERELMTPMRRLIASSRSLVDIGANDGYYTLAFLRSDAARVVACEPGDAVVRLIRNAAANDYFPGSRFSVERRAVGGHSGMVRIDE